MEPHRADGRLEGGWKDDGSACGEPGYRNFFAVDHSLAPIDSHFASAGLSYWLTLEWHFDNSGHLWELINDEIFIIYGTLGMALDSITHRSLKLGKACAFPPVFVGTSTPPGMGHSPGLPYQYNRVIVVLFRILRGCPS
ncbi:hypothetical protein Tco_0532187 [Tanacetum coccineum]